MQFMQRRVPAARLTSCLLESGVILYWWNVLGKLTDCMMHWPHVYCTAALAGVCSMGTAIEISAANLTYKYSTTSPENSFIFGWKVKVTSHKNIAGVGHCTLVCAGFFWLFLLMIMFVCLINENLLMMMLVLGCRAWLHQHRVACRPYEAAWSCLCSWIVSSICLY